MSWITARSSSRAKTYTWSPGWSTVAARGGTNSRPRRINVTADRSGGGHVLSCVAGEDVQLSVQPVDGVTVSGLAR